MAQRGRGDTSAPAGLQLLDTHSWTVRTVAPRAGATWDHDFRFVRGRILARTWGWDAAKHRTTGLSLVAFDRRGKVVYRKGATPMARYWTVLFGRLFLEGPRRRTFSRIDVATGRSVGVVPHGWRRSTRATANGIAVGFV